MKIRCISLWQPWASLIACGAKTIETRGKPAPRTIVGVRIGIHAAKTLEGFKWMSPELHQACMELGFPGDSGYPLGAIVATAVVEASIPTERLAGDIFGDFSAGRFGWVLSDIRRLETPIPFRGAQGVFFAEIPDQALL